MARTRATKATTEKPEKPTEEELPKTNPKLAVTPHVGEPPHVFILPTAATPEALIVTLPHPRHSQPSRYLVCPETGIYEFTKVSAPPAAPRSWLIEPISNPTTEQSTTGDNAGSEGLVIQKGDLFIATIFDPVFLILPGLVHDGASSKGSKEQKRMFLTSDDHFDHLAQDDSHLSEVLRCEKTRALLEARMNAVCDTVEAGDETMFRLNESKLLAIILAKAKRMSENGLPPSMDEKFVKKALEAPLMHKKSALARDDSTTSEKLISEISTPQSAPTESQVTTTNTSLASQLSTAATSFTEDAAETENIVSAIEASSEVIKLQRLRVAFDFICSSYVAPMLATQLREALAKKDGADFVDFSPLDDYLTQLTELRTESLAIRSIGDYSRKHTRDEEEDEARAEKKRKQEEEKKKKAGESRGVRDLKKVNTSGMMKLSSFFKKK